MMSCNDPLLDKIASLEKQLDFVKQRYKFLQFNIKYQRMALLREQRTNFLLELAPRRYRSLKKLKQIHLSQYNWLQTLLRHPLKIRLWWLTRKLQRNSTLHQNWHEASAEKVIHQQLLSIISKKFTHIFFLRSLVRGGSEKYLLNIIDELCHQNPFISILVITSLDFDDVNWEERLPLNVDYLDLSTFCPHLRINERSAVAFCLAQDVSSENTQWHFPVSELSLIIFKKYKQELQKHKIVVYHYSNYVDVKDNKKTIDYRYYESIRDGYSFIEKLISDNQTILDEDTDFLQKDGLQAIENTSCLYTKVDIVHPVRTIAKQMTCKVSSPALFWASRIDIEKRPSLIFTIGQKMQQELPGQILNVYGYSAAAYDFQVAQLPPSVKFHGPFNGLTSLAIKPGDIFIYTSQFDGMPNVVLEAISMGAVVIAPDVGGIKDIIKNDITGILLPDELDDGKMTSLYVDALRKLLGNEYLRLKLAANAQNLLQKRHSQQAFTQKVKQIFG